MAQDNKKAFLNALAQKEIGKYRKKFADGGDTSLPPATPELAPDNGERSGSDQGIGKYMANPVMAQPSVTDDPNEVNYAQNAERGAGIGSSAAGGMKMVEAKPANLVHYSRASEPIQTIDPNFQGTGAVGAERSRPNRIPRSYFYEEGTQPESMVADPAGYKYTVKGSNKILDLASPEAADIIKNASGSDDLERMIKQAGYEGYKHSTGDLPNAIAMFESRKPISGVGLKEHTKDTISPFQSNEKIRDIADEYARSKGINLEHPSHTYEVDPERGAQIADAYEQMPHAPNDPKVKKAYDALISETEDQFKHLQNSGLKVSKITPEMNNPYAGGSKEVLKDINENNHLWYYPTEAGFGSGESTNHPLLKTSNVKINGEKVPANDIFRIVHDYFGHGKEGVSFGPKGEENAWMEHMKMFSPEAQKALTTETRGQNSWVNYGPKGEANRANPNATTYAEQKAGLLPDWVRLSTPTKGLPKYDKGGRIKGPTDNVKGVRSDILENIIKHDGYNANTGYEVNVDEAKKHLYDRYTKRSEELIKSQNKNKKSADKPEDYFSNGGAVQHYDEGGGTYPMMPPPSPSATPDAAPQPQEPVDQQPEGEHVYDVSGDQPVLGLMPHANLTDAIASGKFSLPQGAPVKVISPDGQYGEMPRESTEEAFKNGYKYASPEEVLQAEHGGVGGQLGAAAEGAARGVLGPLAPMAEKALGVPEEDIVARQKANPWAAGLGEVGGLAGSMLTGVGEGALVEKLGGAATKGLLGESALAKGAAAIPRIGSAAVKGAIENMAIAGSDELSKMVVQDPEQTAQTALVDIGLAGVLGGAVSGGISSTTPLWNATVGPKVSQFLDAFVNKTGGFDAKIPNSIDSVLSRYFPNMADEHPELRAALSDSPYIQQAAQTLMQSDTTTAGRSYQEALKNFKSDISDHMVEQLGRTPEEVSTMPEINKYERGRDVGNTLAKEYSEQIDPTIKEFEELKDKYRFADVAPSIEQKAPALEELQVKTNKQLNTLNKQLQTAIRSESVEKAVDLAAKIEDIKTTVKAATKNASQHGTADMIGDSVAKLADEQAWHGSPEIMREVNNVLEQSKGIKTIKGITDLYTAVGNNTASTLPFGQQTPVSRAGGMIKSILRNAEADAAERTLGEKAPQLVERYKAARGAYAQHAKLMEALDDRLHVRGSVSGFSKGLKEMAQTDGEAIFKKLSGKDDADLLKLLSDKFPKTAELIRQNHLDTAIQKSVEGHDVNIAKLRKNINSFDTNQKDFIFNGPNSKISNARDQIEALGSLVDKMHQTATHNFSNSARTMDKLFSGIPGTAMGVASYLSGHAGIVKASVISGAMKLLSKDAPDAIKISMLRFMGNASDVKPAAFAQMVDYIASAQKGEKLAVNATKAIFKSEREVLPKALVPTEQDRTKLDKYLQKIQANPDLLQKVGGDAYYYAPEHAASNAQMASNTVAYLTSQKPNTDKQSPLDAKPIASTTETAKYNRALDIAQQPLMALHHLKQGTLTSSDVTAVKTMYPALYNKLCTQLTSVMTDHIHKGEAVPYQIRVGLSTLMGQPMDSTMTQPNIAAAQAQGPGTKEQQQADQQEQAKGSTKAIGKSNTMYQTPGQARAKEASAGK